MRIVHRKNCLLNVTRVFLIKYIKCLAIFRKEQRISKKNEELQKKAKIYFTKLNSNIIKICICKIYICACKIEIYICACKIQSAVSTKFCSI